MDTVFPQSNVIETDHSFSTLGFLNIFVDDAASPMLMEEKTHPELFSCLKPPLSEFNRHLGYGSEKRGSG